MNSKIGIFKNPFVLFFFFSLLISGSAQSYYDEEPGSYYDDGPRKFLHLKYDRQDTRVSYGERMKLEVHISDKTNDIVDWVILKSELPPGLRMEKDWEEVEFHGRPKFTGRWCFVLGARINSEDIIEETICLYSKYRETDFNFPRFHSLDPLPIAELWGPYFENIELDENNRGYIRGKVRSSELPESMIAYFENQEFVIDGTPDQEGVFEIILKLKNDLDQVNFRQLQLLVRNGYTERGYSCPPSYYYDESLGYCVQGLGDICENGTYYDEERNGCSPYLQQCDYGMYFDDFLEACIPLSYPRCPWGYRWSPYFNRCWTDYNSCDPGYRYSYNRSTCVPRRYHRRCGPNRYWNWRNNRCAPRSDYRRRYRRCGPGWVLNRNFQCVRNRRGCRRDSYYNPRTRRCEERRGRRGRFCGANRRWDVFTQRCVRRRAMRRPGMRRGMRRPPMGMRGMRRPPMGMRGMRRPPMGMRRPMVPRAMPMVPRAMPMVPRAMPMVPRAMTMGMRRPMTMGMRTSMRRPMRPGMRSNLLPSNTECNPLLDVNCNTVEE